MSGENGPAVINGGAPLYDRTICYDSPVDYDDGLFNSPQEENLGTLRKRLLRRLGFSAQANNPPPGMKELLDDFLVSAQRNLYWKYKVVRNERWWTWQTVAGQAQYDVPVDCAKYLEFRKLTWAGCQDDTQWYPLVQGIPPTLYSGDQQSRPQRFDFKQYLEVWPVPDDIYLIRLRGHLGIKQFVADDDMTTVDSELVFLTALANAKAHYEQPDGANIKQEANTMLANIVAGSHMKKRYIPKEPPLVAPPMPYMVNGFIPN